MFFHGFLCFLMHTQPALAGGLDLVMVSTQCPEVCVSLATVRIDVINVCGLLWATAAYRVLTNMRTPVRVAFQDPLSSPVPTGGQGLVTPGLHGLYLYQATRVETRTPMVDAAQVVTLAHAGEVRDYHHDQSHHEQDEKNESYGSDCGSHQQSSTMMELSQSRSATCSAPN